MGKAVLEPLYRQVKRQMLQQITKNQWRPNERLPSEFALAKSFDVSQGTARKALNELTGEGFLTRVQGVGTFVSDMNLEKSLHHFFRVHLNEPESPSHHEQPVAQMLDSGFVTADQALAQQLKTSPGETFAYMERIRLLNAIPVIYEKIYLPITVFKQLDAETLSKELGPTNLYERYQSQFAVFIEKAKEQVHPEIADEALKKHLPDAHLVLRVERFATNQIGEVVEHRFYWIDGNHAHYFANLSR
ncbi:MAG: GntR family transcriptional regulator [Amphritea sp.]